MTDPAAARGFVTEADMAECKATHHLWDETSPPFDRPADRSAFIEVTWRCTRCTGLKRVSFDVHGNPEGSTRYVMPEGYREAGRRPGVERPSKRDYRAWHFAGRFTP